MKELLFEDKSNAREHIEKILNGEVYKLPMAVNFTASTVIDIGANVGAASFFFLKHFPDANYYCYEPDGDNFSYLTKNLASYKNINLFNYGLYDKDCKKTLYKGNLQSLQNSIHKSLEVSDSGDEIELKEASSELTEVVDKYTIIKIDTEGCELNILQSISSLIKKVKIIYLEFHSEEDRVEIDKLLLPTHALWGCSMKYAHRGDVCYVNRELFETNADIQGWKIDKN